MSFATIDINGTTGTVEVAASGTDAGQGLAYFVVPYNAMTGDVSVYAKVGETKTNFADGDFLLQVVPVITGARYYYINGDAVVVTLTGLGIIEANNTQYTLGTEVVVDTSAGAGPDAITSAPNYHANSGANVQVPLSDSSFGPITIKTATASANTGQAIELLGTNFGPGTQVIFGIRDNAGNTSTVAALPRLINADGTRLQVVVPDLATTADVRVSNLAVRDLGAAGYTDAIYRQRTLSFTATDATTVLRFADGGLEAGVDNESWGIDNVRVTKGATTVFSDNFETPPARSGATRASTARSPPPSPAIPAASPTTSRS